MAGVDVVEAKLSAQDGLTDIDTALRAGRFPALSKAVHDGAEVDAGASFEVGLEWVLDSVGARVERASG